MAAASAQGRWTLNAVVTGAAGFVGRALVHALRGEGHDVTAVVRGAADDELTRAASRVVRADLAVPGSCENLVTSGDVLFHAAARVSLVGGWRPFRRDTVDATARLLESALPRGPARFVYVSSAAVYPREAAAAEVSADRTLTSPSRVGFYGRAKLAAESIVRDQCGRAGCPWTILRLGFLYGPGAGPLDRHMVQLARKGRLCILGDGQNRIAACYIDDAVRAILLAGEHPAATGTIYDVANSEPVTQAEFLEAMARALGLPPPRRIAKSWAAAAARLADLAGGLPWVRPLISRAMVDLMTADQVIDSARIFRELGWQPEVAFAEGMRRMCR